MAAEIGEKAPGFTLPADGWDNTGSLEEYTDERPVVLFFCPGDRVSIMRAKRVEPNPGSQPELERVLEDGESAR